MLKRYNTQEQSPAYAKKLLELAFATKEGALGATILHLVNIRVSQLNGCAFCLDMHSKGAKIHGERELRLYHVAIWRESPLFSPKEKAAFEWAEALTKLSGLEISDETYGKVREHLSDKEMSDLTFSVGVINFYNRLNIASPTVPGSLDAMFGLTKAGLN